LNPRHKHPKLLGASVPPRGVAVLLDPSLPSSGWLLAGLHHPLHHVLHPDKRLTRVLLFFHLLRPSKLLGFALVGAIVIGWYKPLLRLLMLRSMRPRGLIFIPWCLVRCLIPWSPMLSRRSSAIMSLSGHFLLGFSLLCFQERALRVNMPTETAVMANGRSFDGMRLLNAWNIIVDLFLLFMFNSGRRLWDCRFNKHSL
jgi:hypothetical protein